MAAIYPADTFQEGVDLTIEASNQLAQVVRGDANTEVMVADGSTIPSIRKAQADSMYFKEPELWTTGQTETDYLQLKKYIDTTTNKESWWFAKSATVLNPVVMGTSPFGDGNWTLYTPEDLFISGKAEYESIYQALKGKAAEAGYNLVRGSFEEGGTLTGTSDVLWYQANGKYYNWFDGSAKTVVAGSTPAGTGGIGAGAWVDRSYDNLRCELGESAEIIGFNQGVDVGGSSNKVNIDILIKRESVNLLRGIPFSEWDAVKGGTSTLDISAIMQNAVNYCASNNAKLDLPHGKLNFSNILLPSSGIDIGGVSTHQTNIFNTSLTTPVFYTATGRNLWINLHGFTIVGKNLATSADVSIQDFEHLSLNDINVTTSSGERTGAPGILLSRSSSSGYGYYLCTEQLKVDKHLYGLKLLGISGANLNSNGVRGAVTNDNTNAGIRADFCSGLRLKDGSAELCRNNIEIFDSLGVVISGYYMERPEYHNIQLIRADMAHVVDNPMLSSAGSGSDGTGSSPNASGRSVFVDQSNSVRIDGNNFVAPWTFYDVELTNTCVASQVTNNGKKDRTNGFNIFNVEVLDSAANSIIRNMQKTVGGAVRMYDNSSANLLLGKTSTQSGKELVLAESTAAIYTGTALPEGSVTAGPGSIYLRRANDAGIAVVYSKRSGTGNTGWVAVG